MSGADWLRKNEISQQAGFQGAEPESEKWRNAYWVEYWEEHEHTISVFQRCQPGLIAGFGSVVWRGLAASEIHSACQMLRIPEELWPKILEDVQVMGNAAAEYLTERDNRKRPRK